jgi:hypothetical protein
MNMKLPLQLSPYLIEFYLIVGSTHNFGEIDLLEHHGLRVGLWHNFVYLDLLEQVLSGQLAVLLIILWKLKSKFLKVVLLEHRQGKELLEINTFGRIKLQAVSYSLFEILVGY